MILIPIWVKQVEMFDQRLIVTEKMFFLVRRATSRYLFCWS